MTNSQQTIKDNSAARVSAKPQHNIRVVKIGGSLLDLPDLSTRLSSWLNRQAPMPTVWIVGGGMAVDALRENICESLADQESICLLYTSPSPRDLSTSRMPSSP